LRKIADGVISLMSLAVDQPYTTIHVAKDYSLIGEVEVVPVPHCGLQRFTLHALCHGFTGEPAENIIVLGSKVHAL
jgi:hypothetical protein